KWHDDLEHIRPCVNQFPGELQTLRKGRITGHNTGYDERAFPQPECTIDTGVHGLPPISPATWATSLSPRPARLIMRISSGPRPPAICRASPTAWADSRAGMIPSVRE